LPTSGAGVLLAGVAATFVGCSQPVAPAARQAPRSSAAPAKGLPVTVKRVIDGDTILVTGLPEGGGLIRLIGINAPETGSGRTIRECFGVEARAWLTRRTPPGTPLRLVRDVGERDRFGRRLAYVYAVDGTFLNAELVASGYAQTMTIPPNVRHAEELRGLERRARAENRGLWGACRRGTPLASSTAFTLTAGNPREDP
jgi:micrococcal nuclease